MRLDINNKINMLYGTNLVCLFSERQTKKMEPIPEEFNPSMFYLVQWQSVSSAHARANAEPIPSMLYILYTACK